jgi:biotin-(acetyl-CoA carboxylase) ligase
VEAIWQGERLEAAVLGVGVNVAPAAVPGKERLAYPATSVESVYGKQVSRPALLRAILEQFLAWRLKLDSPEFLQAWERWLAFRGEWVIALERERPVHEGQLLGLEEDGALRLRDRSGRIFTLHGSEIRLRLLKNRADDR